MKSKVQRFIERHASIRDDRGIYPLQQGHPADVVVKFVADEQIELIVLGASGRTGIS